MKTRYGFQLRKSCTIMTVGKECADRKEAKQWIREYLGVRRLPYGIKIVKVGFEF